MRKNKKGFTIVELVIVIAIIAILAAVLLPTFSSLVKKAHRSGDTQLIRNLNTAVQINLSENGLEKHATMNDAVAACEEAGYLVGTIVAKSDYNIAWEASTGHFVLLDEETNTVMFPVKDDATTYAVTNYADYFVVTEAKAGEAYNSGEYSVYAGPKFLATEVNLNGVGFDAGKQTGITTVKYGNTVDAGEVAPKAVIIRTNSETTTLNVDAPLDTIYHYDEIGIVNITRTANASYHEFGTANFVQNASGRVVAENGGVIKVCVLTAKGAEATLAAVAQEDGGKIDNCYATTNEVANANNGENAKNVQLVATLTSNGGNVLAGDEANAQAVVESKKDEVAAEANNQNYTSLTGVARIGGTGYDTLQAAFNAVTENGVIVLLKDVEYNYTIGFTKGFAATFDMAGHTLKVSGGLNGAGGGRAIKINANGAFLTVKNGVIDGRNYNGTALAPNPSSSGPWSNTRVGGCIRVSNGNCTLENLSMFNNDGWGNAVKIECDGILTMRNCSIESVYGAGVEVGVGTANIYDCAFSQTLTANHSYISNCVAVCYLGTANIYDTTMTYTEEGELTGESTEGSAVCPLFVYDSGGLINIYGGKYTSNTSKVIELDACNKVKYIGDEYTQAEYDAFVAKNSSDAIVNVYNGTFIGTLKIANNTSFNVYGGSFSADVSQYRK